MPDFSVLPIIRQLPDPYVFFDGTRDTSAAALEKHRNEWKHAMEKYEIGTRPDCSDCVITAAWAPTANSTAGTSGTLTVTVTRTTNNVSLVLTSGVTLPSGNGPFPFVIGISLAPGNGPFTGSLPASMFPSDKIATVEYLHDQVAQYSAGQKIAHNEDPFYLMYPELCAGTCPAMNSNSGEYAAWTWGVSRLLDGINIASHQAASPLPLDVSHSAITGCSYAGKMAMWSGAMDERIALTIAQENGGGGAPSWRVSHELETQGSVEDIDDTDYDWFGSQMLQFAGANVYKMPTDHHELMAMVAPRALLVTGDSLYYWLGDRSDTIDSAATEKIYANYGIGDRFGYYIDSNHSHCVVPAYQQAAIQPYVDRFLLGKNVDTHLAVSWQEADATQSGSQQPTIDPSAWTAWWGTGNPAFPANFAWNNGGDVMLPLNQNLTINSGDTVAASFAVQMPTSHPDATITFPYGFFETDVACPDSTSYTLTVPIAGQSISIPANNTAQFASAPGTVTATRCTGGKTTGAYFFALGKQAPGAGNPGGAGFTTTDGSAGSAQTDPINVAFTISANGSGGAWSPATRLNFQNPYSCTPPGCALTPIISWTPATITYPAPLGSSQLNATASALQIAGMQISGTSGLETSVAVPGSFAYSQPAGTVLKPGSYTLSTTFTPTAVGSGYGAYTVATATVPLTVNKAQPVITWNPPKSISCPTALSSTQLDATASVPGTFVYNPSAGTVLKPGSYTLSTTFSPSDSTDYATATATVPLTVTVQNPKNPPPACR